MPLVFGLIYILWLNVSKFQFHSNYAVLFHSISTGFSTEVFWGVLIMKYGFVVLMFVHSRFRLRIWSYPFHGWSVEILRGRRDSKAEHSLRQSPSGASHLHLQLVPYWLRNLEVSLLVFDCFYQSVAPSPGGFFTLTRNLVLLSHHSSQLVFLPPPVQLVKCWHKDPEFPF